MTQDRFGVDAPTARALAGSRRGPWFRRIAEAALVICVVALPALLAGLGLGAPADPGEVERVVAAMAGNDPSLVASFYQLTADPPTVVGTADPSMSAPWLASARRAQVLLLFAASGLLYLAMVLARGRSRGLVACVLLACLPAVSLRGHVLRPETPAVVFALLAVVMLQVFVRFLAQRNGQGRTWERPLALMGAGLAMAIASALSMLCLKPQGIILLIPGALLALVTVVLVWRFARVLRRFSARVIPARAFTSRLGPWLALSFSVILVAAVSQELSVRGSAPMPIPNATTTADGLFFAAAESSRVFGSSILGACLLAVTCLGAGFGLFRVGLALGRRRRLEPDLALFVFALVVLAQRIGAEPLQDALPASPATAVLGAEGLVGVVAVISVALKRRKIR